jgi:exodeoxyribonuclease-5
MILTEKQLKGLEIAVNRYVEGKPWTCIAGYAGSGKSTLVKFIIEALQVPKEEVCYVAFTGKAATVLKQKGCPNAITAHKLLYQARPKPDGTFIFMPKEKSELGEYKVIVVDEVSMLPKKMWNLLISHGIYVIALGDPGQLPPVSKDDDNQVLECPHVFLDEIMRQAQESEIIRLSMHVREGKPLEEFKCEGNQVQIFTPDQVVSGMYDWADQILCATNATRTEINNFVRQQKGFGEEPQIGDKIISLRNHWEEFSLSGSWALTNGAIGTIVNCSSASYSVPRYILDKPVQFLWTTMQLEDDDVFNMLPVDYIGLKTGQSPLTSRQQYQMAMNKRCVDPPYEFAYAYGITCHKAQGSEWDKVLVFEEKFPFDPEEHKRWLYTAITRAKEKLVIVRK